jgi:hypothetical protein
MPLLPVLLLEHEPPAGAILRHERQRNRGAHQFN